MLTRGGRGRSLGVALALLVAAAFLTSGAQASRVPSPTERAMLVEAMVARLTSERPALPLGCLMLRFSVSTVDKRFAIAHEPVIRPTPGCLRYATFSAYVLERGSVWRIVYEGPDAPACSVLPAGVTLDLFGVPCLRV